MFVNISKQIINIFKIWLTFTNKDHIIYQQENKGSEFDVK